MAAFSDDAYNKRIGEDPGQGTLVGNWFEERGLREALGEGRTVPQRHVKRSGLLKDYTKVPSSGPRKGDNTFERVYAPSGAKHPTPSSQDIGNFQDDGINHIGPAQHANTNAMHGAAEEEVQYEEAADNLQFHERFFNSTTGDTYSKPDESKVEKATMGRVGCAYEIMHGEQPDRMLGLANEGLDHPTQKHYSNCEAITHARMQMACPRGRNDMRLSAVGGANAFGKHSEFSKSVNQCTLGVAKDEELEKIFQGLKDTQPLRQHGGHAPRGAQFQGVPSLATLKDTINTKLFEGEGVTGYVALRQRLFDKGDHEGFVTKANVDDVFRNHFFISNEDVGPKEMDIYLSQLVTMKTTELKIGKFMNSLRPSLPQKDKRRVLEAFQSMGPVGDSVVLGHWLSRLQDANVKNTIITAFGAQDEADISDMPVTESVFLELLSDLAPLMDIGPLLE